jgi:hypothetical protein
MYLYIGLTSKGAVRGSSMRSASVYVSDALAGRGNGRERGRSGVMMRSTHRSIRSRSSIATAQRCLPLSRVSPGTRLRVPRLSEVAVTGAEAFINMWKHISGKPAFSITPQSLAGNLQILARRQPALQRLSLLAIFQFPFWRVGDRFEMRQRTVRKTSYGGHRPRAAHWE